MKGLAVSYRFVVPLRMLDIVAAAVARSIIKAKSNLMAVTPQANQIEAPETDSQNPLLPVHFGVAAYLTNGDQSFFDQLQQYFYVVGIPLSVAASLAALVTGHRGGVSHDCRILRQQTRRRNSGSGSAAGVLGGRECTEFDRGAENGLGREQSSKGCCVRTCCVTSIGLIAPEPSDKPIRSSSEF